MTFRFLHLSLQPILKWNFYVSGSRGSTFQRDSRHEERVANQRVQRDGAAHGNLVGPQSEAEVAQAQSRVQGAGDQLFRAATFIWPYSQFGTLVSFMAVAVVGYFNA